MKKMVEVQTHIKKHNSEVKLMNQLDNITARMNAVETALVTLKKTAIQAPRDEACYEKVCPAWDTIPCRTLKTMVTFR